MSAALSGRFPATAWSCIEAARDPLPTPLTLTSAKGGKGTFAPAIDNGNGTYTATCTCTVAGTNAIAAVISGINRSPKPVSVQVTPGSLSWSTSKVTVSFETVHVGSKVTLTLQPADSKEITRGAKSFQKNYGFWPASSINLLTSSRKRARTLASFSDWRTLPESP